MKVNLFFSLLIFNLTAFATRSPIEDSHGKPKVHHILNQYLSFEKGLEPFNYYYFKSIHLPEIQCQSRGCFKFIESKLETYKVTKNFIYSLDRQNELLGTQVMTIGRKSPATIIAVHGLYSDSTQFRHEALNFLKLGFNVVLLTLPGHGTDSNNHRQIDYQDWQKFVERAADFGLKMGDKLIFYGQSTGALLSFWYSLNNPQQVLGQFLIEPAFKVQNHLTWSTCYGRKLFDKAQSIGFLARIFLGKNITDIQQPISLNMGCQVHLMTQSLFPNLEKVWGAPASILDSSESFDSKVIGYKVPPDSLLLRIKVPTFIAYSENDDIVDPYIYQELEKQSPFFLIKTWNQDEEGTPVKHGSFVQQSTKSLLENTNLSSYKKNEDFHKKPNNFVDFLYQKTSLAPYMINFYNYLYNYSRYLESYNQYLRFKTSLAELNKMMNNLNYEIKTKNDFDNISFLLTLSRGYFEPGIESSCEFFNNDRSEMGKSSCNLMTYFLDLKPVFQKSLSGKEFSILANLNYGLQIVLLGNNGNDDNLYDCRTKKCEIRALNLTNKQAKQLFVDLIRKVTLDHEFNEYLQALEANESLKKAIEIPPIIPLSMLNE